MVGTLKWISSWRFGLVFQAVDRCSARLPRRTSALGTLDHRLSISEICGDRPPQLNRYRHFFPKLMLSNRRSGVIGV